MKNRLCALLGASALVVAMAAPAMAADAGTEKPMHHHARMHHGMHHGMKGGMASHESSTDDLNAQSLNAARSGTAPAMANGQSGSTNNGAVAGKPMSNDMSNGNGAMSNGQSGTMNNGAAQ